MIRTLLSVALLLLAHCIARADGTLPGITVNSRQPVHVYINTNLVCENSLNCVIVNLRPMALYLIEVKDPLDLGGKPVFTDRVKTPEKGTQTVVVPAFLAKGDPAPRTDASTGPTRRGAKQDMAISPTPSPREITRASATLSAAPRAQITEDAFDEFMVTLDKASPSQAVLLIESRMAQNSFMVKHVKQILEMYVPGDQARIGVIQKMYGSIADRENAFQLVNTISSSESKNKLSEFIANYNASHPI